MKKTNYLLGLVLAVLVCADGFVVGQGMTFYPAITSDEQNALIAGSVQTNHAGNVIINGNVTAASFIATNALPSWFAGSNTTYAATTTITRADGAYKTLTATGPLVLDFDVASYPTNGFSFVALALYSGTNQVSISTNITSNTWAAVTISTNAWNNLIFFKGVGETQFGVRK